MAIRTVQDLRQHLQWAIELEHATLPPYLCALYSIRPGHNREAAEVIASVFMEEMLHLTLAANILNAVGGAPRIDAPDMMPVYPTFLPHSRQAFQVPLLKFSPAAVETFMRIERPAEPSGPPEDDAFETIGQFYEAIGDGLRRLSAELGDRALFSGNPARQITDAMYYGGSGRILPVADLTSALAALNEIVDQGEGLAHRQVWDGDREMFHPDRAEVAHYFRFHQLLAGRCYRRGDTPQSGPTGSPLAVDWDAVYDMKPNPRSADYPEGSDARKKLDQFNHAYSGVLHLLHQCFNGSPRLLTVATGEMYALKQAAVGLMQLPSGDGGTTVGPSFEYVPPELRRLSDSQARKITVVANGPYLVYGNVPLARKRKTISEENVSIGWRKTETIATEDTYALCRCGRSTAKPFCDGTHARTQWDGSETAPTEPRAARVRVLRGSIEPANPETVVTTAGLVVKRDGDICMGAGFCRGRLQALPDLMAGAADSDVRAHIIGMIERCPSGAYSYALSSTGPDVEPDYAAAVAVTAGGHAGPLWVTGGIPIERADGQPFETRNRVTLCRCGGSHLKPLCDGTHGEIGFEDESDPTTGRP
jgi:CDGSH-type Zn-finger protein